MPATERRDALKERLESICRRRDNGEPMEGDDRYIFMCIEYLNLHESAERNIREFLDLADEVGLFDRREEEREITELKGKVKNLEEQLRIYREVMEWAGA